MRHKHISLADLAEQVVIDRGFLPDFPPAVVQEVAQLQPAPLRPSLATRDMRDLLWVSVDNDDSRDLDQLTYAERSPTGTDKIYVAVADVDVLTKKGSAIDAHAAHNTTSIYTPLKTFPMLPLALSTDLTSLNEDADRSAIVVEMEIDAAGQHHLSGVYPALVRNHAKLSYRSLGSWFEVRGPLPPAAERVNGMRDQLRHQDAIAQRIKNYRVRHGALSFDTLRLQPVISGSGVVGLEQTAPNRANALIENFMIAANVTVTHYMMKNKLPIIKRVVRTPKRWDRIVTIAQELGTRLPSEPSVVALQAFLIERRRKDPAAFSDLSLLLIKLLGKGEYDVGLPGELSPGHFDLALLDYAHTTAPNRRYSDLIIQRMLKSHFLGADLPYTPQQLKDFAARCTLKEGDAAKVERQLTKSAIALVLQEHVGRQFQAVVTGAADKGTWVRLFAPAIEGRLIQGSRGLDVGDRLSVTLHSVDVLQGHIDFVKAS